MNKISRLLLSLFAPLVFIAAGFAALAMQAGLYAR